MSSWASPHPRAAASHAGDKLLDARTRHQVRVADWRAAGDTIVFTNGCFDLLHVGHITLLEDCRRFGSKLILGLNCRQLRPAASKAPPGPIVGERERARVMAALAAVDAVVLFRGRHPARTDPLPPPPMSSSKAATTTVETVVGHEVVLAYGGRVEIVPTVEGFSTTNLVKKLAGRPETDAASIGSEPALSIRTK